MICKKVKELFIDYIENELSLEERNFVEGHIITCKECSNELNSLIATFSILDNEEKHIPPDSFFINFVPNVRNRIDEKKKQPSLIFGRLPSYTFKIASMVGFALILLILVSIPLHQSYKSEPDLSFNDDDWEVPSDDIIEQISEALQNDESMDSIVFNRLFTDKDIKFMEANFNSYLTKQNELYLLTNIGSFTIQALESSINSDSLIYDYLATSIIKSNLKSFYNALNYNFTQFYNLISPDYLTSSDYLYKLSDEEQTKILTQLKEVSL